jgi:hypothetical protein
MPVAETADRFSDPVLTIFPEEGGAGLVEKVFTTTHAHGDRGRELLWREE